MLTDPSLSPTSPGTLSPPESAFATRRRSSGGAPLPLHQASPQRPRFNVVNSALSSVPSPVEFSLQPPVAAVARAAGSSDEASRFVPQTAVHASASASSSSSSGYAQLTSSAPADIFGGVSSMPTAAAAGVSGLGGCGLVLPGREEMQAEFEQLERVSGRPPSGLAEIAARYPSATRPENFPKNRWRDVLPYEETRVRLKRPSGSDYINASYIKPPGEERERYIACQAPLPSTVEDFWYMLLQERVRLVVMLTRLVERERPKACRYWPESEQEPLLFSSGLEVQLLNLEPGRAGKVTVRHLRVRASPSEPWHELHHLHYEDWPDFGVPESTQPARHLLHRLDALDAEYARAGAAPAPIVMHCSAGIGRTGTLIAIHASIASWRAGRGLDVPGCVASMRAQRAGMVQTADQYAFIYRVLKDFLQDCLQAERIQRLIAAMPPPSRSPHAHHRSSTDALSFRIKKQLSLPVFGPPPTSPLLRRPRHLTSSPSSPPSGAPERPHSLSHSIPAIRLSLLSPLPNHSL